MSAMNSLHGTAESKMCPTRAHQCDVIQRMLPPPRPTFFVLGMSLAALSFFSSSHLLQHCIRKVACAHAPGHISPTYVAVA